MRSDRESHRTGIPTTIRSLWIALALLATLLLHNRASAQSPHPVVVGERYTARSLFCRTPAARNALIVLWQQGLREPMPQGCSIENITFDILGIARNTVTRRPSRDMRADGTYGEGGPRMMVPGRFLVAQIATTGTGSSRERIYVFFYSDAVVVRTNDGRPAPVLDDP
jgi:hypothetical protein